MGNEIDNAFEGFDCTFGTAREVEDESRAARAADGAAEGGEGSFLCAFAAHAFGDAFDEAVANGGGRFGRHVSGRDAGASGGGDEARFGREIEQCALNLWGIIRDDASGGDTKSRVGKGAGDSAAGEIDALAAGTGVADGNDGGGERCSAGLDGFRRAIFLR